MDSAQLDAAIAEKFFGWAWVSFIGRPVRSHPDYPKEVRVRRFFSRSSRSDDRWTAFIADKKASFFVAEDVPLAYCYCSSCGPQLVPHYSGDEAAAVTMELAIYTRGLWKKYVKELWANVDRSAEPDVDSGSLSGPSCRTRCLAALSALDGE